MTIDITNMLHMNEVLLIFVVLGIGLLVGKLRIGSFQIGNTIGVLFTALLFGQIGFTLTSSAGNIAFMLFIFAVALRPGPTFSACFCAMACAISASRWSSSARPCCSPLR